MVAVLGTPHVEGGSNCLRHPRTRGHGGVVVSARGIGGHIACAFIELPPADKVGFGTRWWRSMVTEAAVFLRPTEFVTEPAGVPKVMLEGKAVGARSKA